MATPSVKTLLGAVRRRVWRGHFVAAARLALWGSTGLILLAAAVHLVARPVAAGNILSALVVLWASTMAWAGSQRPTESACGLWADRHLGGASAFSTLLDMGRAKQGVVSAQALQWLEQWATARVPDSLRLLAERDEPARLTRALLSMLVCAALAALVLALADSAPPAKQLAAASKVTGSPEPAASDAELQAPAALPAVNDIADALRSASSRDAAGRAEAGGAPTAGPGKTGDGSRLATIQTGTPPGPGAAATQAPSGTTADAATTAGTTQATGAGSGRQAGDSRDNRADVGVSRALKGTMPVTRSERGSGRVSAEQRADMDQLAAYEEDRAMPRTTSLRVDASAAAATPPPLSESTRLSPTETSYVQAWMKASARHR